MQIIDALMSDRYSSWTKNRNIFLGAHLMHHPRFKLQSTVKEEINSRDSSSEESNSNFSDSDESLEMPNCVI